MSLHSRRTLQPIQLATVSLALSTSLRSFHLCLTIIYGPKKHQRRFHFQTTCTIDNVMAPKWLQGEAVRCLLCIPRQKFTTYCAEVSSYREMVEFDGNFLFWGGSWEGVHDRQIEHLLRQEARLVVTWHSHDFPLSSTPGSSLHS